MPPIIRPLAGQADFAACAALEQEIWGLDELNAVSPITLHALGLRRPRLGLTLGAFDQGRMVGLCVMLGSLEPGVAYGHMLGVLPGWRDQGLGRRLMERAQADLRALGVGVVYITFEPLEARNAHLYLNVWGGRAVAYDRDHFPQTAKMHQGLPVDRFIVRFDLNAPPPVAPPLADATPPLVEIPADLQALKAADPAAALAWRMNTRPVFERYLHDDGLAAVGLRVEAGDGRRRCFIVLERA